MAYATTLMQNVGENIDQSAASSYLISTIQGFGLEAEDAISVIDKYNEVANNFAIDTAGIGESLQRSAASFKAANTDLSEAIALVTTANTVLQNPETVGTVFKSLSARVLGAKTAMEELGFTEEEIAVTTSKLRDKILALTNVDILEEDGRTYKSIYEILLGIGEVWDTLDDVDQSALAEMLAGTRNRNALYAVLQNVDTLKKAYETAEDSSGSALKEQENFEKSIQFSVQRLRASLQELQADFLDAKTVKGIVDFANSIVNALDKIIEHPLLASALVGGGTLLVGFKKIKEVVEGFIITINSFEKVQSIMNVMGPASIEELAKATAGLTGAQTAFVLSTQGANAEMIKQTLIQSGLTETEAAAIASKYADSTANGVLTLSYKGLTAAIKSSTAAFIASPIGKVALVIAGIAAIGTAIAGVVDMLTTSAEEAEKNLEKTKSKLSDITSELDESSSRIKEIKAQLSGKTELEITSDKDLSRLKTELEYLEKRNELLKEQAKTTQDEAAKNAYESITKSSTKDWWLRGHGPIADALGLGQQGSLEKAEKAIEEIERRRNLLTALRASNAKWENNSLATDDNIKKQQAELTELENKTKESVNQLLEYRDELAKDSSGKYKEEIRRIDALLDFFTSANDKAVDSAEQAANGIDAAYSNIEILSGVQKLTDGMDQLDKIYADVLNKEDFDFSSLLNNDSFTNLFGNLDGAVEQFGDAYTNFVETVANSPDDIDATQEAFNNLASAYIYSSAQLDNVNEETAAATTEMLKQWGVVNAEEVVTAALTNNLQDLAWAEETVKERGYVLSEMTAGQIQSLIQLGVVSEEAGAKIAWFALQEQLANRTGIYTTNDVQQLYNLYQMAGMTGEQLKGLAKLKQLLNKAELSNSASDIISLQSRINATVAELNKKTEVKLKTIATPKIEYAGGSATQAVADKMGKATESAKEDTEELFDYFECRIEVLNQAIELLGANLENVLGSVAKNQLLDSQRGIYQTELSEYASALEMYQAKANEFLVKLPADIQQKITNGAVALQDFVGDSEGEVLDAIKSYQEWANKVADCTQKLEELKKTLREIELQKFNNIADDFAKRFDIRQNVGIDLIEKQISLFEEAGEVVGEGFYRTQMEQTNRQLDILNAEKTALMNQLESAMENGVEAGTEEWDSMVESLTKVDSSILDCKTSLEKMDNAILKLHTDAFERVQSRFDAFNSEISGIASFFENDDVARIDNTWTKEGLAQLGLQAEAYELATYRVQQYASEIEELKRQYANGKYSATEYADKLDDLKSKQLSNAQAAEDAKDAIMSLNEARVNIVVEGIQKEIEAFKELTDSMVKALDAEEDLRSYQQSIAESNKDITKLERQIAAMQNDSTYSTVAKRKKLEEELAEARDSLAEKEHDHEVETKKNALNEQYEAFEKEKNDEIEALQNTLKDRENIIAQSFEIVKKNAQAIGAEIEREATEHGIVMSSALTDAWAAGENAITSYGITLSANCDGFITKIGAVEQATWNEKSAADQTSVSIANLFGQRADSLIGEIDRAKMSAGNLAAVANAVKSSFASAFGSYDTSGITSSLATVKKAAEDAAAALRSAGAAPNTTTVTTTTVEKPGAKNPQLKGNYAGGKSGHSYGGKKNEWTQMAFASGVHKLDKDELAWTQELGDEVILSPTRNAILTPLKHGDSVLTAEQSEALFQWAKTSPAEFMRKAAEGKAIVPSSVVGDMKLEIGNVLTVNGNIDDTNVKRMESVAQDAINKAFVQLKNGLKR